MLEFEKTIFGPLEERFSQEELGEFIRRANEAVKVAFFDILAADYRRWLEEPIPALDGLTPRQAVAKRSHRQRVVSLLKDIEVGTARRHPDEPGAGFDFSWLWNELGLRRQ